MTIFPRPPRIVRFAFGASLSAALFAGLVGAAGAARAADLEIVVSGVASDEGQVMVGVFDKPDAFPRAALQGASAPSPGRDASGRLTLKVEGLAPGRYAVSAIHDKDGNGTLSTNAVGFPKEPYGFSRDGKGRFGPPSFEDCVVDVPASGARIAIKLN